jgi:hypothetical protein
MSGALFPAPPNVTHAQGIDRSGETIDQALAAIGTLYLVAKRSFGFIAQNKVKM